MHLRRSLPTLRALLICLGLIALIAACDTATGAPEDPGEEANLGSLRIEITGLPPEMTASVLVLLDGTEVGTLETTDTLTDLEPGDYTVTAADVTAGYRVYSATVAPASPVTVVAGGEAGPVTVAYGPTSTAYVTTFSDDVNEPGSLRYLLEKAGEAGADFDRIEFSRQVFPPSGATIELAGELSVPEDVALTLAGTEGPLGEALITLEAKANSRVFNVPDTATLELHHLDLVGGDVRAVPGSTAKRGGVIRNAGELTLTNATVRGGAAVEGGGIYNLGSLTIEGSRIRENISAGNGGGIYNSSTGKTTVTNSTIALNRADAGGGGSADGGGIYVHQPGTLDLSTSTVRENHAQRHGGGIGVHRREAADGGLVPEAVIRRSTLTENTTGVGRGGGLWVNGLANLDVINSTFTGNSAGADGGAIGAGDSLRIRFSTIVGNTGGTHTGSSIGGVSANAGDFSMVGTVVAGNLSYSDPNPTDLYLNAGTEYGPVVYNLVGTARETAASLLNGSTTNHLDSALDPDVDDLADNGGPTPTMALLAGSLAVDFVPTEECRGFDGAPLTVDQRGEPRPSGAACDAGAFEVQ